LASFRRGRSEDFWALRGRNFDSSEGYYDNRKIGETNLHSELSVSWIYEYKVLKERKNGKSALELDGVPRRTV
jgi:hypothetical protein